MTDLECQRCSGRGWREEEDGLIEQGVCDACGGTGRMRAKLRHLVVDLYNRVAVVVHIDNLRRPVPDQERTWYHDPTERERAWQAAHLKTPRLENLGSEYLFIYDDIEVLP